MRLRSLPLWVAAGAVLLLATKPCRAELHVSVHVQGCEGSLAVELQRLANVELASVPDTASGGQHLVAEFECRGDVVALRLQGVTGLVASREISMQGVEPNARPRILAITLAELLRAAPAKPAADVRPRRREPLRSPTSEKQPRVAVAVGPTVQGFPTGVGPLWGGVLLSRVRLMRAISIELSPALTGGVESLSLGRAELLLGSAFAGGAWRFAGQPELSLFVGGRLGWLRARGKPQDPTRTRGGDASLPWGGPVLGFDARTWPARLGLGLRGELGYTALSAVGRVDEVAELELRGAFFMVSGFLALGG